jgi:hypothetical protein
MRKLFSSLGFVLIDYEFEEKLIGNLHRSTPIQAEQLEAPSTFLFLKTS